MVAILYFLLSLLTPAQAQSANAGDVYLIVLGTVQDGGAPHIGCEKNCCRSLWKKPDDALKVVSLGLVDRKNHETYIFEATPDLPAQLEILRRSCDFDSAHTPDGIFLTHAHIGHYTGLMYLGREAMGADNVPVYAMPRMKAFLEQNGPWSQLVTQSNIVIFPLANLEQLQLTPEIRVTPFTVPHRDEFSETVGYRISGPNKTAVFIPDIDKWQKWELSIVQAISEADYAFLDATFYSGAEINHRDISEIPHPFIIESMALFDTLSADQKNKVWFIHMNHTNPALNPQSEQTIEIQRRGFHVARMGDVVQL